MPTVLAAALWAGRQWFRDNARVKARLSATLKQIYAEFGLKARLAAPLLGRLILSKLRREERRLQTGWTYEPPTIFERNYQEKGAPAQGTDEAVRIQWVEPGLIAERFKVLSGDKMNSEHTFKKAG